MFRFDTRDKKPKVYDIAVISVITFIIEAFLLHDDVPEKIPAAAVVAVVYLVAVLVMLVIAFFRQIQYNPYSYNTIYYAGFALFTFFVLLFTFWLMTMILKYPEYRTSAQIIFSVLNMPGNFMIFTSPFILIFSTALCISNIQLIRHEGRRLVNVLGIILAFLLVGGIVLMWWYGYYNSGSLIEVFIHDLIYTMGSTVYLYFECMLIGAMIAMAIASKHEPEPDKAYIIILGCGIRKDGTPTPLLRGRIDRAVAFAKKQEEKTGIAPVFVTSGGQGPNEVISESASMKQYLLEQGIPEERIIEEDQSTSTFENMRNSKVKIEAAGAEGKVAFSTTNYHVFRSGLYARRVKMRAVGMGAGTKWYFWPNAAVREFVGILTEHRLKQALIFGGMILIYGALSALSLKFY